jgi:hypothetical protein
LVEPTAAFKLQGKHQGFYGLPLMHKSMCVQTVRLFVLVMVMKYSLLAIKNVDF